MSIERYRNRPVEFEAAQWTGDNEDELLDFAGTAYSWEYGYKWTGGRAPATPIIQTPNGEMRMSVGDYVTKDPNGDLNVIRRAEFEERYEKITAREITREDAEDDGWYPKLSEES